VPDPDADAEGSSVVVVVVISERIVVKVGKPIGRTVATVGRVEVVTGRMVVGRVGGPPRNMVTGMLANGTKFLGVVNGNLVVVIGAAGRLKVETSRDPDVFGPNTRL
jgi:hypothetical protein